jgi:hypothetical protein
MKSRLTQISLVILLAMIGLAVLGYYFIPGRGGIAWDPVARQVQQARSYSYKMDLTMNGVMVEGQPAITDMKMNLSYLISEDYGTKVQTRMNDQITQVMYIKPRDKSTVMILPTAKKFMRMDFNEEMARQMKLQTQDPRDIFTQLPNCQYTSIGRDTFDGVEVEGVESTDPKLVGNIFETVQARLWSDTRDGWPVRMEISCTTNNNHAQVIMEAYDFKWNVKADPAEFACEIPVDYTEMPKMEMPAMNADTAAAGLKKFSEIVGRYPAKLIPMDMMREIMMAKPELKRTEASPPTKEEAEKANEIIKEMSPVKYLGMFYMQLVQQDKDPKYFGNTVPPVQAGEVLLRWKSADNEYTVIFGDLSTHTITPDELAQLEYPQK